MKTESTGAPAAYSGSPAGLAIFWLEVLELAHGGDDTGVAERLSTLALRRDDLDELFGPSVGARLWADYSKAFASFASDGAADIARKIRERRYDDVEVVPLTGVPVDSMASADRKAAEALRTNQPVFSVRLKRSDETDGIRIDTFVYFDGSWRTALKIGSRS